MASINRFSPLMRAGGALALATVFAAGPGMTAAGPQADGGRTADAAAATRLAGPACGNRPNVVATADGGTREMEICNGGDGDQTATARALSVAIDSEAAESGPNAARTPELIGLRLARARAHVDPSITAEERLNRLTALNSEIKVLEAETRTPAQSQ